MDDSFIITPFWNRVPKLFRYGLHKYPLILAGVLFAVSLLFGGPFLNLILLVVALKYGVECLKLTMEGDFIPPRISGETINSNFGLALKLIFVFFLYIFLLSGVVGALGPLLGIPLYVVGVLLIPAVVIAFVVSEEISYSLNPANWWHIASAIGWPYLSMAAFLFLIDIINSQVIGYLVNLFPNALVPPLFVAVNVYFTVVTFHLLGYVVLQYHENLGYHPSALAENSEVKRPDPFMSPQLRQYLQEENVPGAINELRALIDNNPKELELRRRLYVYLKLNGEIDQLRDYAPLYFNRLAENDRFTDATTVYQESVARGIPFAPDYPGDYLPVMQELRRRHAGRQAVQLAQGFHKRYPNDAHTPEVYLALARILSEELQRDDLALQALHFIVKGFPDHHLISQVKQFITVLSKLQGAAQPA